MTSVTRAAIYVRVGSDDDGDGQLIARQEAECQQLADRLGWLVAKVYSDNNIGTNAAHPRPAYDDLLDDIRAGLIDGLVVWHMDRITRHPAELEMIMDFLDDHNVDFRQVRASMMDLSTPAGRLAARQLALVDRYYGDPDLVERIETRYRDLDASLRTAEEP